MTMPTRPLKSIVASLLSLLILASPCAAADIPASAAKLPDDGVWALYHVNQQMTNGPEMAYKLRISLVGTQIDGDDQCRWIEFVETNGERGQPNERVYIHRVLISERDMLTDETPFERVRKYETKSGDGPIDDQETHRAALFGHRALFLPGPLAHSQELAEPKTVQYQRGDLQITSGRRGKHIWKRRARSINLTQTWTFDYSLWLHDRIPFGFAHAKIRLVGTLDTGETFRTDTFEFLLEDAGTDGKLRLPSP
jgi:hypothetical protein